MLVVFASWKNVVAQELKETKQQCLVDVISLAILKRDDSHSLMLVFSVNSSIDLNHRESTSTAQSRSPVPCDAVRVILR